MLLSAFKIIALVPVKGHSGRIKDKNFRKFNGRPLFKWIIDTLLSIREISKIVINTDAQDKFIKNGLLESPRILVRDRKPEICGDSVSMNVILADDIANVPADIYIMTHVTNPLLSADTILKALNTFIENKNKGTCDSLFTVNKYQSRFYRKDGIPVNHDPNNLRRTQDLEPLFEENSNLYIFTSHSFHKTNSRIGKKPMLFETPFFESVDIDDRNRWELAEMIAKMK